MSITPHRSLRGDKLLLAVSRIGGPSLWSAGGSAFGVSGAGTKMGLRGHRVSSRWLFGSYSLGGIRLHLHVDLRRSIFGYQVRFNFFLRSKVFGYLLYFFKRDGGQN